MPARDSIHDAVVAALIKDGWRITHDPLVVTYGERRVMIDVGAAADSPVIGLERGDAAIAVEIKSLSGPSPMADLQQTIGQYVLYTLVLAEVEPGRELYLAIPEEAHPTLFAEQIGQLALERVPLNLIVVDCQRQEIIEWVHADDISRH